MTSTSLHAHPYDPAHFSRLSVVSFATVLVVALLALLLAPPAAVAADGPYGEFRQLEKAIKQYRKIERRGGLVQIADGPTLEAGAEGPRVESLRQRLAQTGDLERRRGDSATTYDAAVTAAVERFQARHGIVVDGKVGPDTLENLNLPVAERIRELETSLKRQRQFAAEAPDRYVLVNIPGFEAVYVEGGRRVLAMPVVVGKQGWGTPEMEETIEYVELNPDWNVPVSIVIDEIAPKVLENPSYLSEHDMEVLEGWGDEARQIDPSAVDWSAVSENWPYHIRQRPGPENPLGQLKLMFPNEEAIYLHGTPNSDLFSRELRDLSHGCIRLERPLDMAVELLAGSEWTRSRLEQQIASGDTARADLPSDVPVFLVYWPAWVDDSGEVQIHQDLYDRI